MSRGPDADTLLARALLVSARAAHCPVQIVDGSWERWASATFVGARHVLTLGGEGCAALDAWVAALPDAELQLRGHLVADLIVCGVTTRDGCRLVRVEALTVEQ